MTIHQIECFLEAARTLNFTEAANHLYISQQGLSRQIASLEKELELTLHPNKVFLQQAHKGSAFLGIFVKPHRRYLLQKIKSRISNRMERMNRCLSAKKVNRDKLLYISCVANSYMGYMRHMACHRFKNLLVERNTSFHRIGNFKGEKLIFVPFIKGIVPLMK